MGLISWWKNWRNKGKKVEDRKPERSPMSDGITPAERKGLVQSASRSPIIGGSGCAPSPSRKVIGGSRPMRRHHDHDCDCGEEVIDLVDVVTTAVVLDAITDRAPAIESPSIGGWGGNDGGCDGGCDCGGGE